jgi:AraC-like DNA-binding protein
MTQHPQSSFAFRSYGTDHAPHSHDHVQMVLPLLGELEVEIEGHAKLVHRDSGILIVPGRRHDQEAIGLNRFLVVDCDLSLFNRQHLEQLARRPVLSVSNATRRLIEFIDLSVGHAVSYDSTVSTHALPLLLDALLDLPTRPNRRLTSLLRRIETSIEENWPVSRMALFCEVSESRLHALFQTELGTTPQLWLTETRLQHAQHYLRQTNVSIAEIALRTGYSDQTALTRAMRRRTGQTPGEFRKLNWQ